MISAAEFLKWCYVFNLLPNGGGGVTPAEVQEMAFNIGTDTGVADAYEIALTPALTAYNDGQIIIFTPANTNLTNAPTVDVNGLGIKGMIAPFAGIPLFPGDINNNSVVYAIYSTAQNAFIVINPYVWFALIQQFNSASFSGDAGVADAYDAAFLQPGTAGVSVPLAAGYKVALIAANSNTGPSTLDVNTSGTPLQIETAQGTPLIGGEILAGNIYYFTYNGVWVLENPSNYVPNYIPLSPWPTLPEFTFATPGDLSVVYTTQVGNYSKQGDLITATFRLSFTPTFTTSAGAARIINFPASANADPGFIYYFAGYVSGPTFAAGRTSPVFGIEPGDDFAGIATIGSGVTGVAMNTTNFTSGAALTLVATITYPV